MTSPVDCDDGDGCAADAYAGTFECSHGPEAPRRSRPERGETCGLAFAFSDHDISEDFMLVVAFVEKPIEPQVLLDLVAEHLPS